MKTINDLVIYFMCCFIFATLFITYLSVKLRAYRIKNASLTNRIEIADKDIADAYDEVDKLKQSVANARMRIDEYKKDIAHLIDNKQILKQSFETHRTESAAIINQSAENNAKLVAEIESLKSDRQKLFDIAKGATAKLAEMNIALEGLEVKEGWIEDITTINFKENEGRTFEVKMKSPSGEIHTGRVSVWGDYNQAVRIDDGSFGTWRWDINSDGTLKQDSIRPFTFRWID